MKKIIFIVLIFLFKTNIILNAQTVFLPISVPSGTLRFSPVNANMSLQTFGSTLGYNSPRNLFYPPGMVVFPSQCKSVLLKLAVVNFTGDYNPTIDNSDPNVSYGYRYLRGSNSAAAKPEFAPFILLHGSGYAFQEFSQNVPLSAWDVTNPSSPQRLSVGFLENNTAKGLVDGKYWPGSDLIYENAGSSGPREWLFIFDEPYSNYPNAQYQQDLMSATSPQRVMYMATWNRINGAPFSPTGSPQDQFLIGVVLTSVGDETQLPQKFSLEQNFPNPFNPTTVISYQLKERGFVSLKIYDALGKEITALVSEEKQVGKYQIEFDGSNLSSGIYFYQLRVGSLVQTKKLALVK